ncbi:unnamed protein product [Auanema sp. JU1783]|nr:unnamed protein product [Auanema sp. JU1783]
MSMRVLFPFLLIVAVVYTYEDSMIPSLSLQTAPLEMQPEQADSIQQRPIMIQTRRSRTKLECILNLRSFELCRNLF